MLKIGLISAWVDPLSQTKLAPNFGDRFPNLNLEVFPSWIPVFASRPLEVAMQVLGHCDAALAAVEEGADVVVIDSIADFGLAAMRESLPVPVFAPGELGLELASHNNRRFGIVTVWPESMNFLLVDRLISTRRESLCIGIVNIGHEQSISNPRNLQDYILQVQEMQSEIVERVTIGIAQLAALGAEAVVLGCTCMHDLAEMVAATAPVPVINPLELAVNAASHCAPALQVPKLQSNRDRLLQTMVEAVAYERHGNCAADAPSIE